MNAHKENGLLKIAHIKVNKDYFGNVLQIVKAISEKLYTENNPDGS